MDELNTKSEYVVCPTCGRPNPALIIYRAMLEVKCSQEIKDKEKRRLFLKRLRSLSWEDFAKLMAKI